MFVQTTYFVKKDDDFEACVTRNKHRVPIVLNLKPGSRRRVIIILGCNDRY